MDPVRVGRASRPPSVPAHVVNALATVRRILTGADRFGHRQHLKLTWLAVRRYGRERAIELISKGNRHTDRYTEAPQKYHATISRAWVEAVAHHLEELPEADFDEFTRASPLLLDKRLLLRWYSSRILASQPARAGWVEPDLAPFPWDRRAAAVVGSSDARA